MPVATPLSLKNISNEFGYGALSTQTFNSGSGSVTAPANARVAVIKIWGAGGGGGGAYGFGGTGGGGGGFVLKSVAVTGGSTSISYSVGAGGSGATGVEDGQNGGNSTATVSSVTYTAGGGGGGKSDGVTASVGGTASGGDINEVGGAGITQDGGDSGGQSYGGGAGGTLNNGTAPGGGGAGDDSFGFDGAAGRVTIDWLGIAFSEYTRTGGLVPNHSQNSAIPTSTTNLSVSDFNDAGLHFTATVTGDGGGSYGYYYASYGSIDRDQFGTNRNNTNQIQILGIYETRTLSYDLLGNPNGYYYYLTLEVNGDTRDSTLGYRPFSAVKVNNNFVSYDVANNNTTVTYSFGVTKYTPAIGRLGSLVSDAWSFDQSNGASNPVTVYFNEPKFLEFISTTTVTSGSAAFGSGTPISPPAGAEKATIKIWGGGAGGSGGTGGGGGGFATITIPLVSGEQFYYSVENGGNFGIAGQNGGNTSITSTTNIFNSLTAYGGIWDGTGGTASAGFGGNWVVATTESGGNNSGSNGGDAGGLSYGGGTGGAGAGANPGAGGASGFAGGEARLVIDWYAEVPYASYY
jgi:hypothetical protein